MHPNVSASRRQGVTVDQDAQSLKQFISDDADLERLEAILDDFNLFAALRLTSHEIRHSAFLRWIFDPAESHGLGDYPLRLLLKRTSAAVSEASADTPTLFDLDGWDLSDAEVTNEWQNIDLLVRDDANHLVCAIENKIESSEHGNQLKRYRETVDRFFPGYRKVFLFLTPSGEAP